jgi:hypothetical protein
MLDDKHLALLLYRWKTMLQIDGDDVKVSSKDIQNYVRNSPEKLPEYGKNLAYSGKS